MEFKKYFIHIVLISLVFGIIIALISNNLYIDNSYLGNNFDYLSINNEEELLKILNHKKNELEKVDKIRRKELEYEIDDIYEKIIKIKKSKIKYTEDGKEILAVAYALNNGYVYQTLVAMTSLAENVGVNTFYNIYLLVNQEFTEKNKKILRTVEKRHIDHCKLFFINMGDKYQGKDTNKNIPTAAYYRLDLQNILQDVDRIIYMDGDTIVYNDLSDLITLDMKGNYILGFLDNQPNALKEYNLENAVVLCSGVLLMDLEALRRNHIEEKYNDFLEANLGNIYQHDQTTINVVCQEKISVLPPQYGIWNFKNKNMALEHLNLLPKFIKYNETEYLKSYENPIIMHYVISRKPWFEQKRDKYINEWWKYANISGYYNIIYTKFNYSGYLQFKLLLIIVFIILNN